LLTSDSEGLRLDLFKKDCFGLNKLKIFKYKNSRSESLIRNRESHRLGNRDNSRSEIRNRESHRIEVKERIRNRDSRHVNNDLRNGDIPVQRSTRANPNVATNEKNNISVNTNGYAKKALTRFKMQEQTRRYLGIGFNNIELQNPKRKTKMKYSLRTKKK
jgi:hypothetical protein